MGIEAQVKRLERLAAKRGLKREPTAPDVDGWSAVSDEQLGQAIAEMRAGEPVTDPAVNAAIDASRAQWAWVKELPEHALDKMVENLEFLCDLH